MKVIKSIINGLFSRLTDSRENIDDLKKYKYEQIDMNSLMTNLTSSKDLYLTLSKKYHPDKILDKDLKNLIEPLFSEITSNRHDVTRMKTIEEKIKNILESYD